MIIIPSLPQSKICTPCYTQQIPVLRGVKSITHMFAECLQKEVQSNRNTKEDETNVRVREGERIVDIADQYSLVHS